MSILKLKSKDPVLTNGFSKNEIDHIINDDDKPKNDTKLAEFPSTLIIGSSANIKGNVKDENEITIYGSVEGDIECKKLTVGKSGSAKGKIITENLVIEGNVDGEIKVRNHLTIFTTGRTSGKISYGLINIDDGGKIEGEINYKDKNIVQEDFDDWKPL